MAVTPEMIAVALGRTAPADPSAERSQWLMWIDDARMLIAARLVGTATGQVASLDDLDQAKLDYVVREAVVEHIKHPDDATQVAVSVDDGSLSKTYRSSRGRVVIRDEWWPLLAPTRNGRAFSLAPYADATLHADVCALTFGALYCSCGGDIAGWPLYELGGDAY